MKKNLTLFCFFSLIVSSSSLPVASDQFPAETLLGLPAGAIARLGRGGVNEVRYSPDGSQLAVASDIGIWLNEAETGEPLDLLTGHTDWVSSVAFSPDGRTLASGSADGTVRLWDVATGKTIQTLNAHWYHALLKLFGIPNVAVSSVAFSVDGRTLASGNFDGTVRLWDVATGKTVQTLNAHTRRVSSVAFSSDGRTLASGSYDTTVRLWDVNTGDTLKTLNGHIFPVKSVAFSPDGRYLASSGEGWDDPVRLWDVNTGDTLKTLNGHTRNVISVAFSPDGKYLASGGGWDTFTVRLWDVNTGEPVQTLAGHTRAVSSIAFSPDGRYLASASDDNTVLLWDLRP